MKENLNQFLTVKELSTWIKLSESHIYFLVSKNKIPFAKLGGKILFDSEKIKSWVEDKSNITDAEYKPIVERKKRKSSKSDSNVAVNIESDVQEIQEQVEQPTQEIVEQNHQEDIANSPLD
jgi:excisionase family DNA binding protein